METKTVGIVLIQGDDVLLVRHLEGSGHINDTFGLPAGRLEAGEDYLDGAIRELKEETGLDVVATDLIQLPVEYRAIMKRKTGEEAMVWRVYTCSRYTGQLQDSEETHPEWVKIGNLGSINLVTNVHNAIQQALDNSSQR